MISKPRRIEQYLFRKGEDVLQMISKPRRIEQYLFHKGEDVLQMILKPGRIEQYLSTKVEDVLAMISKPRRIEQYSFRKGEDVLAMILKPERSNSIYSVKVLQMISKPCTACPQDTNCCPEANIWSNVHWRLSLQCYGCILFGILYPKVAFHCPNWSSVVLYKILYIGNNGRDDDVIRRESEVSEDAALSWPKSDRQW